MTLNGLIAALLFLASDWLISRRVANYYLDFKYRYWPLSVQRAASVIVMDLIVFAVALVGLSQPLWLNALFAALILWGALILADISKQRRGYVAPPRSESEYSGS